MIIISEFTGANHPKKYCKLTYHSCCKLSYH